jgi:hypothetical protein
MIMGEVIWSTGHGYMGVAISFGVAEGILDPFFEIV